MGAEIAEVTNVDDHMAMTFDGDTETCVKRASLLMTAMPGQGLAASLQAGKTEATLALKFKRT